MSLFISVKPLVFCSLTNLPYVISLHVVSLVYYFSLALFSCTLRGSPWQPVRHCFISLIRSGSGVCITLLNTDDDLNGNVSAWEHFYFWHMHWRQHLHSFFKPGGCHSEWDTRCPHDAVCFLCALSYVFKCSTPHVCSWLNSPLCGCCSSFVGGMRSVCRLLSRGSVKLRGFPPCVAIGISLCIAMGNGTFLCAGRV